VSSVGRSRAWPSPQGERWRRRGLERKEHRRLRAGELYGEVAKAPDRGQSDPRIVEGNALLQVVCRSTSMMIENFGTVE